MCLKWGKGREIIELSTKDTLFFLILTSRPASRVNPPAGFLPKTRLAKSGKAGKPHARALGPLSSKRGVQSALSLVGFYRENLRSSLGEGKKRISISQRGRFAHFSGEKMLHS
jgi:hypothetical protein